MQFCVIDNLQSCTWSNIGPTAIMQRSAWCVYCTWRWSHAWCRRMSTSIQRYVHCTRTRPKFIYTRNHFGITNNKHFQIICLALAKKKTNFERFFYWIFWFILILFDLFVVGFVIWFVDFVGISKLIIRTAGHRWNCTQVWKKDVFSHIVIVGE